MFTPPPQKRGTWATFCIDDLEIFLISIFDFFEIVKIPKIFIFEKFLATSRLLLVSAKSVPCAHEHTKLCSIVLEGKGAVKEKMDVKFGSAMVELCCWYNFISFRG